MFEININKDFTVHPRAKVHFYGYEGRTLDDVYGKYSWRKEVAYERCRRLCEKYNGYNFGISSHNCDFFTVMFFFDHPETGESMVAKITAYNNHVYYVRNMR